MPHDETALLQLFLNDDEGFFSKLETLSRKIGSHPELLAQREILGELFRLFHTIKGNAMAFGLDEMVEYAHALESLLQKIMNAENPERERLAQFVVECVDILRRGKDRYPNDQLCYQSQIEEIRKYKLECAPEAFVAERVDDGSQLQGTYVLSVVIGVDVFFIPCDSIFEVLTKPEVIPAPFSVKPKYRWVGLVPCAKAPGGLVPLVDPAVFLKNRSSDLTARYSDGQCSSQWVVIFRQKKSDQDEMLVAIPVDDVRDIVEFSFDKEAFKIVA